MQDDDTIEFSTKKLTGKQPAPNFKYRKVHGWPIMNQKVLTYLLDHNLCVEVYGCGDKKPSVMFENLAPRRESLINKGALMQASKEAQATPSQQTQPKVLKKPGQPILPAKPSQPVPAQQPAGSKVIPTRQTQNNVPLEQKIYTPPVNQGRTAPQPVRANAHPYSQNTGTAVRGNDHGHDKDKKKKKEDGCLIF